MVLYKLATYLGATAVALGFVFTFFTLGADTGTSCGTAWGNGDDVAPFADQAFKDVCTDARSERWMLILTFIAMGAAAVAAGMNGTKAGASVRDEASPPAN